MKSNICTLKLNIGQKKYQPKLSDVRESTKDFYDLDNNDIEEEISEKEIDEFLKNFKKDTEEKKKKQSGLGALKSNINSKQVSQMPIIDNTLKIDHNKTIQLLEDNE